MFLLPLAFVLYPTYKKNAVAVCLLVCFEAARRAGLILFCRVKFEDSREAKKRV